MSEGRETEEIRVEDRLEPDLFFKNEADQEVKISG